MGRGMAQLIITGVTLAVLLQAAGLSLLAGPGSLDTAAPNVAAQGVDEPLQLAAK